MELKNLPFTENSTSVYRFSKTCANTCTKQTMDLLDKSWQRHKNVTGYNTLVLSWGTSRLVGVQRNMFDPWSGKKVISIFFTCYKMILNFFLVWCAADKVEDPARTEHLFVIRICSRRVTFQSNKTSFSSLALPRMPTQPRPTSPQQYFPGRSKATYLL